MSEVLRQAALKELSKCPRATNWTRHSVRQMADRQHRHPLAADTNIELDGTFGEISCLDTGVWPGIHPRMAPLVPLSLFGRDHLEWRARQWGSVQVAYLFSAILDV